MTDEELEALAAGHELDHTDEDSVAFDEEHAEAPGGRCLGHTSWWSLAVDNRYLCHPCAHLFVALVPGATQ